MEKITNVKALEYVLENADLPAEYAEKIAKIKESFEKKASGNRKPTARQTENVQLQADIEEYINGMNGAVTASEVLAQFADKYAELSLPRVSAALTALVKAEAIERYVDKKKAYFKAKA
jgi:hypothetical protein